MPRHHKGAASTRFAQWLDERIKGMHDEHGYQLSIAAVERKAGFAKNTIARWITKGMRPEAHRLRPLGAALGVPLDVMLDLLEADARTAVTAERAADTKRVVAEKEQRAKRAVLALRAAKKKKPHPRRTGTQ